MGTEVANSKELATSGLYAYPEPVSGMHHSRYAVCISNGRGILGRVVI